MFCSGYILGSGSRKIACAVDGGYYFVLHHYYSSWPHNSNAVRSIYESCIISDAASSKCFFY